MRTVRLMTCNDAFQAQIISGALENEGIPSVLHNVNTSYVLRGAISQIAGVDIFVYEADYNRAKRHRLRALFSGIIAALAAAPPGTEHWEFVCRNCGAHFDRPVSRHSKE